MITLPEPMDVMPTRKLPTRPTAMVIGPSLSDFSHSDEKRSRSDRDDGRDMYR